MKLSRDHTASNGRREAYTWLPIHEWTETEVWQHIRASGVPYHPAYDAGMTRLSCSLYILGNRADLLRAARLRPDLTAEYARIEDDRASVPQRHVDGGDRHGRKSLVDRACSECPPEVQ
ncbi:phosphoadenosine phosphosulfate reductase family protein [Prauserella sp. PE36]|uniref:phosphoadenosine phosphosulfate reductase domain-containing protein n=1 Tax=Prauserella sp. PE36 TaxID=1504709 RepID=UPI003510F19F